MKNIVSFIISFLLSLLIFTCKAEDNHTYTKRVDMAGLLKSSYYGKHSQTTYKAGHVYYLESYEYDDYPGVFVCWLDHKQVTTEDFAQVNALSLEVKERRMDRPIYFMVGTVVYRFEEGDVYAFRDDDKSISQTNVDHTMYLDEQNYNIVKYNSTEISPL